MESKIITMDYNATIVKAIYKAVDGNTWYIKGSKLGDHISIVYDCGDCGSFCSHDFVPLYEGGIKTAFCASCGQLNEITLVDYEQRVLELRKEKGLE